MSDEAFDTEGNTLRLKRNPELTEMEGARAALLGLLRDSESGAVLDMTATPSISSTTVGMAVAAHLRAAEAGRGLKVRIRKDQLRLFELTMLTKTLDLEVTEKAGGAD
jgi:anti-anti-sigma regulatory factor